MFIFTVTAGLDADEVAGDLHIKVLRLVSGAGEKECHLFFAHLQIVDRAPGMVTAEQFGIGAPEDAPEKLLHTGKGVFQFHRELILPSGKQIHKRSSSFFCGG